jgi:superfamily I DNA/RNA helicase
MFCHLFSHLRCLLMLLQDVMAYLRLAVSLRDDVALARIINTPRWSGWPADPLHLHAILPAPAARNGELSSFERHAPGLAFCFPVCRRAVGDTSVARLQEYAAARGQTLCGLLFGNRSSSGSSCSGSSGEGVSGSSSTEVAEDGLAAELALPVLPDRKELGLTAKAATAVEALRQLMAGLHATVIRQPLPQALEEILARVCALCFHCAGMGARAGLFWQASPRLAVCVTCLHVA